MRSSLLESLLRAGRKAEDKPAPQPDPEAPLAPVQASDPLDPAAIHWLGQSYAAALETANLSAASMDNRSLELGNGAPSTWPKIIVKVEVQGIVCLFYEVNGAITGGKFDWLRPGQTSKGLENVHNGYGGHIFPEAGAKCYACFVSVDGKQRSNIIEVKRK